MAEKIQLLTVWTDQSAKALFEHYERKVAEAFILPPELIGAGPRVQQAFHDRAMESTAYLQRSMMVLLERHTAPGTVKNG